jgi:hypothetical protein
VGQKLAATAIKQSSRFVASCGRGFRRHSCDDGMCGVAAGGRHPNTPLVCYNSPNSNTNERGSTCILDRPHHACTYSSGFDADVSLVVRA